MRFTTGVAVEVSLRPLGHRLGLGHCSFLVVEVGPERARIALRHMGAGSRDPWYSRHWGLAVSLLGQKRVTVKLPSSNFALPFFAHLRRDVEIRPRIPGHGVTLLAGTTFGMMLANVPAVLLGDRVTKKVPIGVIHGIAAIIFAILGIMALFNIGSVI